MFFDLLLSDWVQALGFSLNFAHASEDLILNSSVCVTQGVLIQLGDVSSAFSTLLIAIHTFIVLVIRSPPTTTALLSLLAIKWFAAIVLAIIGPVFFATQLLGPFCESPDLGNTLFSSLNPSSPTFFDLLSRRRSCWWLVLDQWHLLMASVVPPLHLG